MNYYHTSSSMGGHRDDAEPFQGAPIVSISLGLSAVRSHEAIDLPLLARC